MNEDLEKGNNGEEVGFLPLKSSTKEPEVHGSEEFGPFLTREDLIRLDAEEPSWRRIRLGLLILFWVLWIGLLAASVIIIVLSPKCPPKPDMKFWQSKFAYWVNPFAFRDSDGDLIGDLRGLFEKVDYIKDKVGAGFIILSSIFPGYYSSNSSILGPTTDYASVDPKLGTMDDFHAVVRGLHKNGLEVVISMDFNSVSLSHQWANQTAFLAPTTAQSGRDGSLAKVSLNQQEFYSVLSKDSVDLNLLNNDLRDKISEVVKFWLNEGVDGILLENCAFLVESNSGYVPSFTVESNNTWFRKYPASQIYGNGSVEFIAFIRKLVDEVSTATGRPKLLIADAGDTGYGLSDTQDEAMKFLGSSEIPGAHLIISRQFVKHRGWKATPSTPDWQDPSVKLYDFTPDLYKPSLGLTTSSTSDQQYGDILSLASTLLLPGTPILYYGSELATNIDAEGSSPTAMFPKGRTTFPNLNSRDTSLPCILPMPWDRTGQGFSSAMENNSFRSYLDEFRITDTVKSALSVGRGQTPFQMVKELATLRQEPSLLWGSFKHMKFQNDEYGDGVEVFVRKAEGFPAFVVALLRYIQNDGAVFDFSSVCEKTIVPRLAYPSRSAMAINKPVESNSIYLTTNGHPAVYVFSCA
ncbi:unnamed protein product [Calicophoron daubneyi]|uniref:Glycosyl hydrolase family 13 catalytic domain-containing protein n=1 Tax=Calicophoron daubneyi TaxID=300641 RepID=A0AAV2TAE6_CALDB